MHASGRGNPWINLSDGRDMLTGYTGAAELQQVLEHNLARPLALASADFDEDGVPDLIGGYAGPGGGIITLHRGNVDSIYPHAPEAQQRRSNGTYTDSPFLSPAHVFEVAEAPDFVGAGDFDADSHWDVVTAARGSNALWLLPGDGQGSFGAARRIDLPGRVTTLLTGEINRADGLTDVVVGVIAEDGPKALVFESPVGALRGNPEAYGLPAEATAIALGRLDGDYTIDLAVGAGSDLIVVYGRDRKLSLDEIRQAEVPKANIGRRSFPFAIRSAAIGDFTGDHRTGLSLLSDDGAVYLLSGGKATSKKKKGSDRVEEWKSELLARGPWSEAAQLVCAQLSSTPVDNLVVVDSANHKLHIIVGSAERSADQRLQASGAQLVSLDVDGEPMAVLPMRLNVDALSDLVILRNGQSALTMTMSQPQATFTVTNTSDSGTGSLRQAIFNANANAGLDTINFSIGSGVQTINVGSTTSMALPDITSPVIIDGTTQPGYAGSPLIELNGTSAGVSAPGVSISAGSSTVKGLVINRFNGVGIILVSAGGNVIAGNYIGTDVNGTADLGNTFHGVFMSSPSNNNTIGGTAAGARNVISGNNLHGIEIGGSGATGNLVQGNYIGTDVSGTADLGNTFDGVAIGVSPINTIGGTAAGARNVISGNNISGISSGATGNLVQGNFIGTNVSGTAALGNNGHGVLISGPANNNTIGGTAVGARNVISGNNTGGISITGSGATGILVQGNYIGTNVTGTADLGNTFDGVFINGPASNNTIGGTAAGARNVISGNNRHGIEIGGSGATGNQVQGNYIGTDVNGTAALGNTLDGVFITGANNTIGRTARNVISGNNRNGIEIANSGATGNLVEGNYIGTDVNGTADLGNTLDGVFISGANNTIGTITGGLRNVISGNNGSGIHISGSGATGNQVQGNFIGTEFIGTGALGNSLNGIHISLGALSNTIGGTTIGSANTIAFNGADGVFVETGVNNAILNNAIYSNTGLGIDLFPDGVTPNDACDPDTGANNLQNFPILTSASTTSIQGTLNSTANTTFTIRFIVSTSCDPSGNGEGEGPVGSTTVTTNASCNASFNLTIPLPPGHFITATATDPNNNTSEFSACRLVTAPSSLQFSSATFSAGEPAGTTLITVTRSGGSGGAASVQFATAAGGTATGGASCTAGVDYVSTSGTLNWADGDATNKTFSITICNDTVFEGNETVNLALSNASGATLGTPNTATLSITDDDPQPTISITDVTQAEGHSGTTAFVFTVSLSNPTTQTVTVNYATANGTATAGSDYQAIIATTLTFNPGVTSLPVNVLVNGDTLSELNERFSVNLSGATNATIADSQGVGTINDDDPLPNLTISDVSQAEGNSGTASFNFTVSLSAVSGRTVTVNYATADGTGTAGSDYQGIGLTALTFTPGQTSKTVTVLVNGDTANEPNETFFVSLSGAANANITDGQGQGTILNDDGAPTLSINDVSVTEGNSGTVNAAFTVSLSPASGQTVTVNYATANGTATAGSDYQAISATTLTFNPGVTSLPVNVLVIGDTLDEDNETFFVNLSIPSNATIADNQGVGTINDDDALPNLSISDVSQVEGNSGTPSFNFTVSLSAVSGRTVTVNYATADGTGTAGSDYQGIGVTALTFTPGQTSKTVTVLVTGDTVNEPPETFFVNLSGAANANITDGQGQGTILNDDGAPTLSINDVSVTEGDSGTVNAAFTVSLSSASGQTVTVNYATANGTATAGSDYQAVGNTTLTFNPGEASKPVTVVVIGDTLNEADETVFVNLTNATNATIADSQGVGTITNDDPVPTGNLKISGRIVDDSAGSIGGVIIILSGAASGSTTTDSNGNYSFANLSAGDYTVAPSSGNYSFSPANQTFNNLSVDRIANFVGTQTVVSITGKVTDSNDIGLGSVTLGLSKNGTPVGTVSTDVLGNYSFGSLAAGANYMVTPAGSFTPSSQSFSSLTLNATANFTAAPSIPPQCNTATFAAATNFDVGDGAYPVAVGDFNGDGKLDLAVANFNSSNVSILLGTGTGSFSAAANFAGGLGARSIAVADFNGDGKVDLAVANDGSGNVSILLGTGTGSFSAAANFAAGSSPGFVAVGDFNGDSKLDLAVANIGSSNVSILLGTGTGSLGAPTNFAAGSSPFSVAVGDFNGDSKLDLAVANQGSSNVSILLGTGTGSFGAATNFAVGSLPGSVAVGDFNGDGKVDLAVANAGNVSILLGTGAGTFGAATNFASDLNAFFVAAGDFNGDSKLDLAVANGNSQNFSILLGTGTGSFSTATNFTAGTTPLSVATGDFNGDSKLDLAVANINSDNVSILLNNGSICNTLTSLSISGRIADANNSPLPDVTVTLSGPITRVVQSDATGIFTFANLAPGGNYAVTIQSPQYVFAPSRSDFFNLSSSQIANFTAAPVVVPPPLPPPSDDFAATERDANKWSLGTATQPAGSFDPQVTVSQVNGQLVISPLTQASGLHYAGFASANSFDMRGGSISVELVTAATGGADTIFAIGSDSDNFYRFMVHTAGPATSLALTAKGRDGIERPLDTTVAQLIFQVNVGGQLTALSIPYDPVQHRFMRFRHDAPANAIVFETSPNSIDFTEKHRVVLVRSVSALTAELSAGTSNPANPGPAVFDNFGLVTSTFQFSSASYTVDEGGGSILITVTRAGSTAGTAAVDYATADGTASQSTRYINAAGRLMFAPGEASKTFRVLIVDNAQAEGNQNLNLLLQEPAASGLSTPGRAVLTIIDNDTTVATSNPLSEAQFYVRQHYLDFLNREPDAAGLAFWVGQITSCGSDTQCLEIKRINVSAAFYISIEFQETGYLVHRFYNLALNRANGLPRYLEFLRDTQTIGTGVVVGAPGWEPILEANKVAYANEFVARAEYTALYPLSQTPEAHVDALYAHAGITPSAAERQAAIDEFIIPTGARGRVLRRVAENQTLRTREFNRAFVLAQYFGYLRRNPDDPPDNNLDGYNFWLTKLNQFNGNFVNAEMVKAFINSGEYRHRFGP